MVNVSPCRFEQCLSAFPMLVVEGYCETALFRYLPNNVFGSPQFYKYISYEGHLFFLKVQNLVQISKLNKKIRKDFLILR